VPVIEGWIAGPEVHLMPVPGGAMLYDSSRVPNAERGWLDEGWWARRGTISAPSEGRGNAHFIDADGRQFVLRHYRRGGIAARILPMHLWVAIGRCLRRFHERGVFHADLNARNILIDTSGSVWVIDFDRSEIRTPGWWCDANLARLHRSLRKLIVELPEERFTTADWHCLLDGYFSAQAA
jgi:hypothetical protein